MHDVSNGSDNGFKIREAISCKVVVKLVPHVFLEMEAYFFGEVSIVHCQESIVIYGKFIAKLIASSIDLFLFPR